AGFGNGAILRIRLEKMALDTFYPPDGGAKRELVLDAPRGRLYATDMDRDSLFAFDLASRAKLAEIHLGPNPNGCALSPDGKLLFACTRGTNGSRGYEYPGPDFGELVVIDAETLDVVDRQWGGDQPTGLAVSPDGSRVILTNFLDHQVEAYDIRGPGSDS
ncbi:MAG: YncE family protein, partial [Spirochaetaceae bacterium]|nr:YncE family protein [Spirochaetaceae bacterium]